MIENTSGIEKLKSSNFPMAILLESENRNKIMAEIQTGLKFTSYFVAFAFLIKNRLIIRNTIVAVPIKAKPSYAPSGSAMSGINLDQPEESNNDNKVDLNRP